MPVFSRYNPRAAGGVLRQSKPNAEPYPWIPPASTVRADPNWGGAGRVHRIQPHERGVPFIQNTAAGAGGSRAQMSSMLNRGGCDGQCGGCGGCGSVSLAGVRTR